MQPLQNVLSISTAGKNRYLFHFNSLHSLTQWTAGIRLAMFEHATLQEAYTGSLIAGKGKTLNNIRTILDRTKLKTEDWTRVRFGAGTPWRRCWCVISPPDEKDVQKQNKSLKKKSAYDRPAPALKGDIKFYDTKKTKKTMPIATINDAYSAYAIYPQSKPLIDQSTLVKVEGNITIHSTPETITEGFVFVMPEVHPGVNGFEIMLRWLFPLYDVFTLYGRPNRLVADTLDVRSLMFALPQERRYGYLEILDVAQLIHEPGSQTWKEMEWRRRLKELTSSRIAKLQSSGSRPRSRASTNRGHRNSLPSRAGTLRYEDGASIKSTPSIRNESSPFPPPHHTGSAPPAESPFLPPRDNLRHQRSVSEVTPFSMPPNQRSQRYQESQQNYAPSRLSYEATPTDMPYEEPPPVPPVHGVSIGAVARNPQMQRYAAELEGPNDRSSSESERRFRADVGPEAQEIRHDLRPASPPTPVVAPPVFAHEPGARPQRRPELSPELRRATSRMSITTLAQLADAGQLSNGETVAAAGAAAAWRNSGQQRNEGYSEDHGQRGVIDDTGKSGTSADLSFAGEGMVLGNAGQYTTNDSRSQFSSSFEPQGDFRDQSINPASGLVPPPSSTPRNISPLSQSPSYPESPISHLESGILRNNLPNNISQPYDIPTEASIQQTTSTGFRPPPIPVDNDRPDMRRLSTSHSITRKPVPPTMQQPASEHVPASRSSLESLRQQFVDEDALNQVIAREPAPSDTDSLNYYQTHDAGSIYDGDSTASPDYASTRQSTETKRSKPSMDKPRRGVLKTVGTIEPEQKQVMVGDMHYQSGVPKPQIQPAIPSVDFGPTHAYTPGTTSRPGTSGTLTHLTHERPKSRDRLTPSPQLTSSPRNETPDVSRRSSKAFNLDTCDPSGSRNFGTPEHHTRTPSGGSEQDNRRSVAWQPGATIGSGSPGNRQSITPEQFVQQRAAQSGTGRVMTPIYAHGRKQSSTPPMVSRNPSAEIPTQQHVRQPSYSKDLPPRPHSRGASNVMNTSADYSAHLSAREQEHVSRVTGSPLINVASNPKRQQPQGGGLIGAIEAREQEKKNMKEGLSGQLVQQAIAQRQQHSQGYQTRQQSFPTPSPQFSMPGQYPATPGQYPPMPGQYPQTPGQYGLAYDQPQYPLQQPQQQWGPPGTQAYWGNAPTPPQYRPQLRQGTYSQEGQPPQGQNYQNPQHNYGPYFGNGQGGRQ